MRLVRLSDKDIQMRISTCEKICKLHPRITKHRNENVFHLCGMSFLALSEENTKELGYALGRASMDLRPKC